ncbi:MAG: hypothetical protein KME08_20335 [Aphanothece sp. CMT-3BRIN-NPC111]|nr:hypothetical protein [Aphanothece sp. CMT-3BRIN-NPC111]
MVAKFQSYKSDRTQFHFGDKTPELLASQEKRHSAPRLSASCIPCFRQQWQLPPWKAPHDPMV